MDHPVYGGDGGQRRGPASWTAANREEAVTCCPSAARLLAGLETHPERFAVLVAQHDGSLALSAHRLASARVHVRHPNYIKAIPTALEIRTAALEIAERSGWLGIVPTSARLARECVAAGLDVSGI